MYISGITKYSIKKVRNIFASNTDKVEIIYEKCLSDIKKIKLIVNACYLNNTVPVEKILNLHKRYFNKIFRKNRKDCITNSISLHMLLYIFGYKSFFYIGITRFPFSAHAWVEDENHMILNSPEHLCRNRIITIEKRLG